MLKFDHNLNLSGVVLTFYIEVINNTVKIILRMCYHVMSMMNVSQYK